MRLLNRAAAKWSRYKHRALGRQLASRARGCLRLWLSDLRSKHAAPYLVRRGDGEKIVFPASKLNPAGRILPGFCLTCVPKAGRHITTASAAATRRSRSSNQLAVCEGTRRPRRMCGTRSSARRLARREIEILLSKSVVAEGQDRVLTQSFRCLALIIEGSLPQGEIPSEFRAATGPGGRSPILSSIAERRALNSASGRAPPPMGSSARDW